MRIAAYTGGHRLPSARLRVRQYGPHLRQFGIEICEYVLGWESSLPAKRAWAPAWMAATFAQRAVQQWASYGSDVTLIQRQLLPAFIPTHRFTKAPRVLDVDDAIWLNRGGKHVAELANSCERIICGNRFLADQFSSWNDNVVVLPTPVDTDAIVPDDARGGGRPLIGWTGTGENLRYLYPLEHSLAVVLERFPEARLMVVSDMAPKFSSISAHRIEYVAWTRNSEIATLRRMAIGIMPLEDTLWTRGKCAFKMLCYMAAGVPVVVSPVGMNAEVLKLGELGIGAVSTDDWVESLSLLLAEPDVAARMGTRGREIAVTNFSLRALAPRLAAELRKGAGLSGDLMLTRSGSPCAV